MSLAEENKEKRRQQILQAAEGLIRKDGEVGFSMETLAKEAGVSFATPFNLFGKKNDILAALVSARINTQLERFELASGLDPLAGVLALVDQTNEIYLSDAQLYRPIIQTFLPERLAGGYTPPRNVLEMWQLAIAPARESGELVADDEDDEIVKLLHLAYTSALLYWATGLYDDEEFCLQARQLVFGVFARWLTRDARQRFVELMEAGGNGQV